MPVKQEKQFSFQSGWTECSSLRIDTEEDTNHYQIYPIKVSIRLMFLRIGEIDTLNEKYQAQIAIEARWQVKLDKLLSILSSDDQKRLSDGKSISLMNYTELNWHPQLFIENAIGDLKEQIRYTAKKSKEDNQIYVCEHRDIKGLFWEKLELHHFPSDIQELSISIGSVLYNDKVILIADPYNLSGINREIFIDQQEWKLYEYVDTQERYVKEYLIQNDDEKDKEINSNDERKRSFLTVSCHAARRSGYFYWNGYCLVFLITICAFCTFSIPPNLPHNRLQITATLLLTSITFRWTVNRSLPTISYLTTLDKYAITSIFILIILCVWHAIIGTIIFIKNHQLTINTDNIYVWIDRYLFFTFSSLYGFMHFCMMIWFYKVPFGFQRRMKQRDIDYRNNLKLKQSSDTSRLNNSHTKTNKFSLLDIMTEDDINTDNNLIKTRMAYL
ncbi:unnamed protein product [Adineta steineri]|uniref:Neurotransmitter-gated ion-channel ligand-binding domain-containing protein n=1 Tax=Adineta steineri TaxID=433720 RepID=A0A814TT29_9BILA|nr:unnamed protein product [Adineta steineri]